MKKDDFNIIQKKLNNYKFSSMAYTEYEDICDYEVEIANDDIILIYGFNTEAKTNEYHWAANTVDSLLTFLGDKKDFLLTFAPHEWIPDLEKAGFVIRNAWHDYFNKDFKDIVPSSDFDFLKIDECTKASELTLMCRNQSRGFTGQTPEWISDWINNKNGNSTDTNNNAILVERNENNEILGLLCTATYPHTSKSGNVVWVRELAVNPKYQNQGIGRKLLMNCFSYGKFFDADEAYLAADEQNDGAIHLYRSVGFRPSNEESQIDMLK